jgi:glycosyltransferase involved in cell wall biosynthesis
MNGPPIIFVAHDVGGSGGMERHSEELITRLLADGYHITVVARTCAITPHPRLRFRRIYVPRRPFAIAYPAFFLAASVLLRRRRGMQSIVHTTGAVIGNRADLSTIHYCHRAAAAQTIGSRASRPGRMYRANELISLRFAELAEAWCYRPGRTHLLCAVSHGVAAELRRDFPKMASRIATIPNGVDTTVFRSDSVARVGLRNQLNISDDAPVALFAGGDWERKGLQFAVDALVFAPDWHVLVAGPGDPTPYLSCAAKAGTGSRLHFLGRRTDMPTVYAAADAFVFPTAYEAFPLVALEAAASGLPLLITHVNGVSDLLHDGVNGWFIERNAADIATRLRTLQSDPALGRSMAASARLAAQPYSWEAMALAYRGLYDRLARRSGSLVTIAPDATTPTSHASHTVRSPPAP